VSTLPFVIDIDDLRCEAGGRTTLHLPRLHIAAGERVAIVGHNGAGKSTLLRALGGFVPPAHGRLQVLGRELGARPGGATLRALRCEVAQVMQGLHLVQRLTARENVLIGALGRLHGWRSWARLHAPEDVAEADRALDAVGLSARAGLRADRLSGGERQKVALARMLMQRPRLILADEPTASLDPAAALEVCRLLVRAAALAGKAAPGTERGATLITVVHHPALLPVLADRVIGLRGGRLAFDLPVSAVDAVTLDALYRSEAVAVPRNGNPTSTETPLTHPSTDGPSTRSVPAQGERLRSA
jgi:phosphonate transport system ATP-binding protein